jgi:CBS domain-containing protein
VRFLFIVGECLGILIWGRMTKGRHEESLVKDELSQVLRSVCKQQVGVLDSDFLCRSIGTLAPSEAIVVSETTTISAVIELLQQHRIGCVAVVDQSGALVGIFSERDYVLRVHGQSDCMDAAVALYMTPNPVSETMQCTIAFALNLMSHGGFRHLPIVDENNHPVAMVSVKDVVDHLVKSFTDDLLDFEEE